MPSSSEINDIYSFATYGRSGASARVRLLDWFEHLNLLSHHFDYLGLSSNSPKELIKRIPSVISAEVNLRKLSLNSGNKKVIISREASPFSSGKIEHDLLSKSEYGIYDFDDALFAKSVNLEGTFWPKYKIWKSSVQTADVVIAGSEYLADAASNISNNVVYIPSCVEPSFYQIKSDYSLNWNCNLVWLGSPSTEHHLSEIEAPLLRLHKEFNVRLTVISSGSSSLGRLETMVDRIDWDEKSFTNHLANADIGIMPLVDHAYSRGKCAYKILQYAAAGLPLVASPVGANSSVIKTLGAFPATNNSEWYETIKMMILTNEETRRLWGEQLVHNVQAHFSYEAWSSTWKQAVLLEARGNN